MARVGFEPRPCCSRARRFNHSTTLPTLNVEMISSFCLPYLVEVSVFRMLSFYFTLVMVTFICCENVSFGS